MNQPGANSLPPPSIAAVILVPALSEWRAVKAFFNEPPVDHSPFGEYFSAALAGHRCILLNCGWGKVSAAASAQFAIDRWQPRLILNIGTCGGFEGLNQVGEFVLANETLIYDIHERMGNPDEARRFYATPIDLSTLRQPLPGSARIGRLASADQDIDPRLVRLLLEEHEAVAADWESGAIAWVARRNRTPVLILRVVSDLVSEHAGELYNGGDFSARSAEVMMPLLAALPGWLDCALRRE